MVTEPRPRPAGSVGLLLSAVGRSVGRSFHTCLEPLGLDPRQYLLLQTVGGCQDQSQHAVGSALQIPPSRMVVLVDRLEARGLIERVANPVDRRAHALRLTGAGRQLLQRAVPVAEAFEAEVCRPLSAGERAVLLGALGRIADDRGLSLPVAPAGGPGNRGAERGPGPCRD
jgi:DNA-binding MarR family transcriptional regulator